MRRHLLPVEQKESKKTVIAALFANLVIAIAKFGAALITRSSAMLSEAIHSTVDTCNELLLLLGRKRSKRPEHAAHPFGHGQETYFWTLMVAVVLFGVGGGMSVFEGISHIAHPNEIQSPLWSYLVLGIAACSESVSWSFAVRSIQHARRGRGFWETIHATKDPQVVSVFLEDTAALLGILLAVCGVFFSTWLHMPVLDGAASVGIGLLLATVSVLLAREVRDLLLGESADPGTVRKITEVVNADPAVETADRPLTMHFGPEEVLLNLDVQFRRQLSAPDLEAAIRRLEEKIRKIDPRIQRIFIEVHALAPGTA